MCPTLDPLPLCHCGDENYAYCEAPPNPDGSCKKERKRRKAGSVCQAWEHNGTPVTKTAVRCLYCTGDRWVFPGPTGTPCRAYVDAVFADGVTVCP